VIEELSAKAVGVPVGVETPDEEETRERGIALGLEIALDRMRSDGEEGGNG